MKPCIRFNKIWADEDMLELRIEISDGDSLFVNKIYVDHQLLAETVSRIHRFKDQINGGIFDLRFGAFGPEYASGALDVRMHFRSRGKLVVRVLAESEFRDFEGRDLASDVTLHLMSEPALLDNFIVELSALSEGRSEQAELEAVERN